MCPASRRQYAFVVTRAGTDTMPTRREEDEIEEDAAPATARGGSRVPQSFGSRASAAMMTPPAPERPSTPDDLRTALRPAASSGVKLKTTAPSPFSLKLLRTLCVWAVTLPTTTTLESPFLCLYVLR